MKNSLINFQTIQLDNYIVKDFSSLNILGIYDFVDKCPDYFFDWIITANSDKIERISLDLYGSTEYWDLLLLINGKDPLFDMSYDLDIISQLSYTKVEEYNEIYNINTDLPDYHKEYLKTIYESRLMKNNEDIRPLRIVKPSLLHDFIQLGYEQGYFV